MLKFYSCSREGIILGTVNYFINQICLEQLYFSKEKILLGFQMCLWLLSSTYSQTFILSQDSLTWPELEARTGIKSDQQLEQIDTCLLFNTFYAYRIWPNAQYLRMEYWQCSSHEVLLSVISNSRFSRVLKDRSLSCPFWMWNKPVPYQHFIQCFNNFVFVLISLFKKWMYIHTLHSWIFCGDSLILLILHIDA